MNDREEIRASYKTNPIKVLFIAESPPEGAHFFYTIDTLTLHTQQAFADVFNEVKDMSGKEFLDYFRKVGCYLEDLCTKPVNKTEPAEREETRRASIPELAKRLKTYESKSLKAIFIIMKDIKPHVKDALG